MPLKIKCPAPISPLHLCHPQNPRLSVLRVLRQELRAVHAAVDVDTSRGVMRQLALNPTVQPKRSDSARETLTPRASIQPFF